MQATIPHAATGGTDDLHFDHDDDDWYIMLRLYERNSTLTSDDLEREVQTIRAGQRRVQAVLQGRQTVTCSRASKPPVSTTTGPALQWPPGRAGRFAQFIYGSSYSPVREVSIVATLALLAGVCGRGYRTYTGKDLGLYFIIVARSGIGKDSTHDCIPMMLKLTSLPLASRFVRAQDFVSGEALHKELLREPGFLALQGEFGRRLKRMSNPTDTPMQSLRTVMTNAYAKQHLEGKSYSKLEDTMLGVDWPALSFLGETTPSTFLECLTPDMMADGFLSRFLTVNYEGHRPPPNRSRDAKLDSGDLQTWTALVGHMIEFQSPINTRASQAVEPNIDAQEKLEWFEEDCRASLNATEDESERQVWSRAHLKALKVASLLAVADNCFNPIIRIEHVAWSLNLVRDDIERFQSRKRSGDIGTDDDARERKLLSFMREYLQTSPPASYKVSEGMRGNSLVSRAYLQVRASSLSAFSQHRLGSAKALDATLQSLVASGYILEADKLKVAESYGFHGKAYRILKLPEDT